MAAPTAVYTYGADGSGRPLTTAVYVLALKGDTARIAFPTGFRPHLDTFGGEADFIDGTRIVPVARSLTPRRWHREPSPRGRVAARGSHAVRRDDLPDCSR